MNDDENPYYGGYHALVSYIEENTQCSYAEFLSHNRDVVLSSQPFSDDWGVLDITWARRFLKKAKDLKENDYATIEEKVKKQRANKSLQIYWETIIYERKKMEAQRAHLTGSMRVYSEVAEHNSETLSSEDYSNIFTSYDSERKSYTQAPGIEAETDVFNSERGEYSDLDISDYKETDDQEGKEATNDKVTPSLDSSSEYIPSEESEKEDDEFELKFKLIPLERKKAKLKLNEPSSPSPQFPRQSIQLIPTDNQLRRNDFITGESSKMVGNYIRGKTKRSLEAGDDYDLFYNRQYGQDDPIEIEEPIEEPSLDKIAQEQNDDEEERMLKIYHQGGPPSQPSCDTVINHNNELDKWAKETTLQRNGEWIIGTNKVNVRDLLTLWQNEKKRPHNDLAYYDIIDVTPGTNSNYEFEEMKKYGSPIPVIDNSDIKGLIVKLVKEPDFQKNNFLSTRNDDRKKFTWDFAYQLKVTTSAARYNDTSGTRDFCHYNEMSL